MTIRRFFNTAAILQYTNDVGSDREIRYTLLIVLAIWFQLSRCNAVGLNNHTDIQEAKSLIDALDFKLHLQLQTYQAKHQRLKLESTEYLARSYSTKEDIKTLEKLKRLLNDLTKKSSICETFYTNFDFTVARQIIIDPSTSAPKEFTCALQGTVI